MKEKKHRNHTWSVDTLSPDEARIKAREARSLLHGITNTTIEGADPSMMKNIFEASSLLISTTKESIFKVNSTDNDESFGSIGLFTLLANQDKKMTLKESSQSFHINKQERVWEIGFAPFGEDEKIEELATESMYLGCVDLIDLITEKKDDPSKPTFILGYTNQTMAKFAINHLGFHEVDEAYSDEYTGQRGEKLIIAETEHILTDQMINKLTRIKKILHKRAVSSSKTLQEEEGHEKELRIIATFKNMKELGIPQPLL